MPPKGRPTPPPAAPPPRPSLSLSSDSTLSLEPLVLLPPDGGYGWVVVATCFLINVFTDGAIYTFGFYQQNMQDDFDKDSAAVALMASLCSGFYNVAAPLWSAVGNRWGFRTVSVVGALAAAGALVACFFITEYAVFVLVYGIVLGAASGGVYVATMISVGFYFERWRGVATSLTSCGSGVGILVMPLCYKTMSSFPGYTWRWILAFNASVFGVVLLLSLLLKPLQPVGLSTVRGERTVRFQEAKQTKGKAKGSKGSGGAGGSLTLRQLHASQTSFSPSVAAPQFDAISMTSRAFPRSGGMAGFMTGSLMLRRPDARDMQSGSRPMYRDDIFYGASASRLTSQMSTRMSALPVADAVDAVDALDAAEDGDVDDVGSCDACLAFYARSCSRASRCSLCPHAVTSTLGALLHHSILTNAVFMVFAVTQVCVMMVYYTPFLFSQDQAVKSGVDPSMAEWILPAIGVANAVGRALSGVMCEVPGVSALVLSSVTMSIAGIMVAITCLCASPLYQLFVASAYGFFIAPFMAMKSLILVDFLGIERLTNSFGLLLMFQGFATMIGPPLSGWIHDITQSYHYVYVISGSFLLITSLLPYLMYPLSNYERRKEMKRASRRSS